MDQPPPKRKSEEVPPDFEGKWIGPMGRDFIDKYGWDAYRKMEDFRRRIPGKFHFTLTGPWEPLSFKGSECLLFGIGSSVDRNVSVDGIGLWYNEALYGLSVYFGYPEEVFGEAFGRVRSGDERPSARIQPPLPPDLGGVVDRICHDSAQRYVWQPFVREGAPAAPNPFRIPLDEGGLTYTYGFEGRTLTIPSLELIERLREAYGIMPKEAVTHGNR